MCKKLVYLFFVVSLAILGSAALADSHKGGCEDDGGCPVGEICTNGECTEGRCIDILEPVCGVDGKTYTNRCYARLAHVEVGHDGECGRACGGFTGQKCPKPQFCEHEVGTCNVPDNIGVCTDIPEICPRVYDPVCGCDGVTYSNDCVSRQARVSIAHRGECKERGGACKDSGECDRGQSCQFRAPSCGDGVTGVCVARPRVCTEEYDPECGCDGVTYSNTCYRLRAGASLLHKGECRQSCGGIVGPLCPEGDVCDRLPGECNVADAPGECVPRPELCPDIWDPVCACDGKTYANDCERLRAGVTKDHHGPCSGETSTAGARRNCYGDCLAGCREAYLNCVDGCREKFHGPGLFRRVFRGPRSVRRRLPKRVQPVID